MWIEFKDLGKAALMALGFWLMIFGTLYISKATEPRLSRHEVMAQEALCRTDAECEDVEDQCYDIETGRFDAECVQGVNEQYDWRN